ncbi:MAG: helix-turn-helix domain-containing protein [Actinomycetota bacterium]|nr:helix-turn-helix domain-containing protein [Actinomycetota bacterium]
MRARPELRRWALDDLGPAERDEVFRSALDETHLPMTVRTAAGDGRFAADIRRSINGDLELVRTDYDGPACEGSRSADDLRRADRWRWGLLVVLEGRERIRHAGRDEVVGAGDLLLWSSDRPLRFTLPGSLRKLSLLVDGDALAAAVPRLECLAGRRIPAGGGAAAVLRDHLRALDREAPSMDDGTFGVMARGTFTLLAATLESTLAALGSGDDEATFARVEAYLRANLEDPQLRPAEVAHHHGLSERTLQRHFAARGTSPTEWIRDRRLEASRRDVAAAHPAETLTDIAFRWGFRDSAHFARLYKRRYGVSPSADRGRGPVADATDVA